MPRPAPHRPRLGANSAAPQLYGNGGAFFNVNSERPGRVQMWNIFIERQLSRTWFVSAGYSGSHGMHLFAVALPAAEQSDRSRPACWPPAEANLHRLERRHQSVPAQVQNPLQPATGTLLPFVGALGQRTIPQADLYYPYLALLGDTAQNDNGWSDYNSLKVRIRHSFTHGFLLDANYTWSKAIDTATPNCRTSRDSRITSAAAAADRMASSIS